MGWVPPGIVASTAAPACTSARTISGLTLSLRPVINDIDDGGHRRSETIHEDGVDVFRRQPDGRWKIHISHAFTK